MSNLFFKPEKPEVPEYKPISLEEQQAASAQANINNFGLISKLADLSNQQGISMGMKQIEAALGGTATVGRIQENIAAATRGEIPQDVQLQLRRYGAEAAVGSGTRGSVFAANRTLRDLGLTSMQMTQYGQQAAQQWGQFATSRMPTYDFTSMYTTPAQMTEVAFRNTENQFNRQWMQNQINAEYSRQTQVANAMADFDNAITQMAISYAGSMSGGGSGGSFAPTRQSMSNISAPPANTYSTPNASYNTYGLPTEFAEFAQY